MGCNAATAWLSNSPCTLTAVWSTPSRTVLYRTAAAAPLMWIPWVGSKLLVPFLVHPAVRLISGSDLNLVLG
jgi:hypothetical protein